MSDVTRILCAIDQGDPAAAEQLLPLVYEELRRLAAQKLSREKPGRRCRLPRWSTKRICGLWGARAHQSYHDRRHFFACAATAMRRILVDAARAKQTQKRGGGYHRVPLQEVAAPLPDGELLALHEALDKLAAEDPQKAQLVELRYFAGLTADQAAEVLGIPPSSADRHWAFARAWLQAEVRGE